MQAVVWVREGSGLAPSDSLEVRAGLWPGCRCAHLGYEADGALSSVIAIAAKQSILSWRGEIDCFAALAMTVIGQSTGSRSRGAMRPEFCISLALMKKEGAGKTGCALHPRSHVR